MTYTTADGTTLLPRWKFLSDVDEKSLTAPVATKIRRRPITDEELIAAINPRTPKAGWKTYAVTLSGCVRMEVHAPNKSTARKYAAEWAVRFLSGTSPDKITVGAAVEVTE
jgi:hypothetical protein